MNEQLKQLNLQKARIFLSYAKEDKEKVKSIYRKLLRERLNPWLDLTDLLPGQEWDKTIVDAIRNARFVIVFLSSNSINKRGFVQREIREALDMAERMPEGYLFIIPVRLEGCTVPSRLSKWQWIDVHKPGGFGRILKTIRENLGSTDSPDPPKNKRHFEPMSHDEIADSLLLESFSFGSEFKHTRIPTGEIVVSNAHFMDFRDGLPKAFRELERQFRSPRKLTPEMVSYALPAKKIYRKPANLLTQVKPVESEPSAYVLVSKGNNRCGIHRRYMHYVQVKYPTGKIYLVDQSTPIVVEESKRVRFIVMPFNVGSKALNAK